MPGRSMARSIRDFWRVCSGITTGPPPGDGVPPRGLNVGKFPMTVLDRPIESETCKIKTHRATPAFLNE